MEAIVSSKPPRRWSKRRLVLVVSGLIVGVLALVVGVVGVARSAGFVMHAIDATGDVGQIAPDRETVASNSVPRASDAPWLPQTPSSPTTSVAASTSSSAPPSAVPPAASSAPPSGGATSALDTAAKGGPFGGVAGVGGTGGSGGAVSDAAGNAAAAGASPTFWEGVVQGALTLLGQSTSSMCGRNTCNVGQVCCNTSCGICVAQGATCDQKPCTGAARAPTNVLCGSGQCNDGQVCCNPSCGTCAAPGETCSEQQCR